jgi:hypothetical protein
MIRGPRSGNDTQPSAHYLDSADLVWPRPRPGAQRLTQPLTPGSEMDPLVAGMPRISPRPASGGSDRVAQSQLLNELPAFSRAYASGDSAALNTFAIHGVSVTGLGGALTFDQISALHVPPGGTTGQIMVTAIWQLRQAPGSAVAGNPGVTSNLERHGMSVVDLHGGKWYVKEIEIGASSEVGAR